jgi:hypothetical protein
MILTPDREGAVLESDAALSGRYRRDVQAMEADGATHEEDSELLMAEG